MGVNFYWHEKPKCDKCGRCGERVHIGKSSFGWCFGLHIHPHDDIYNLSDWIERFDHPGSWIENEYGEVISKEEMLQWIRREGEGWDEWRKKHGKFKRHEFGGRWGMEGAYGEGDYDLCNYDFS